MVTRSRSSSSKIRCRPGTMSFTPSLTVENGMCRSQAIDLSGEASGSETWNACPPVSLREVVHRGTRPEPPARFGLRPGEAPWTRLSTRRPRARVRDRLAADTDKLMTYVGRSLKRREDERLLQGRGAYVADVQRPGTLHLAVVRSPHAHARIRAVDVSAARACPGIVDIVTFDDVPELARAIPMRMSERGQMSRYLQRPLACGKVRYVGEPVVAIVATDRYRAEDALACVQVTYDPLPALVDTRAAGEPGAPLLFEAEGTNVVATYTVACGDVERALREADLVLRETLYVQRHAGVPMETRGALAEWDAARGVLSMWGMTKVPHVNRRIIAEHAGLPEHSVHFLQTDVGGAFGVRGEVYPEDL